MQSAVRVGKHDDGVWHWGGAHGKDCQGVNFPEQAQIDGSTLKLNGLFGHVRRRS